MSSKEKEEKLKEIGLTDEEIEEIRVNNDANEVAAVAFGEKRMWYGSIVGSGKGQVGGVRQSGTQKIINYGKDNLGLSFKEKKNLAMFGKESIIDEPFEEVERIEGDMKNIDSQFHRIVGKALDYDPKEIENFVNKLERMSGKWNGQTENEWESMYGRHGVTPKDWRDKHGEAHEPLGNK